MISPETIVIILFTMTFAGIVQGAAGFGFGIISVGLLGWFVPDLRTATMLPLLANIALTGTMFYKLRKEVCLHIIRFAVISSILCVPVGALFLTTAQPWMLKLGIGLLLLGSAAYALHPHWGQRPWHRVYAGLPLGALSGLLGGAFNTGGPPIIAFLTTQRLPHIQYVATMQLFFFLAGSVRLVSLGSLGLFTSEIAILGSTGIIAAVTGAGLGLFLLNRIPGKWMRWGVIALQIAIGISYLVSI